MYSVVPLKPPCHFPSLTFSASTTIKLYAEYPEELSEAITLLALLLDASSTQQTGVAAAAPAESDAAALRLDALHTLLLLLPAPIPEVHALGYS